MLLDLGVASVLYDEDCRVSTPELFPVPRPMANATPKRFKGCIAIVTGGGSGIGAAICRRLAADGAHVVVVDKDVKAANKVSDEITTQALGPAVASSIEVDMAVESDVERLFSEVGDLAKTERKRLAVLVNNAAQYVFRHVTEVTEEDWDRVLGTNVKGYAFGLKRAVATMRDAGGGGAVVNVASISSFIAQPGFVPYSTSKGAILQLTRCAALDAAGAGVRVNAVCPGPIMTPGTQAHAESQGKTLEDTVAEMTDRLIIKRMGKPEEVAAAVSFLASDEASFITGTTLMVDGGYTAL